jgi:glucose/mannose-6-phosphate isomerase
VLIVGLGGSAIGGDVAAQLAGRIARTPVSVVRNYHLPPLDRGHAVILSSFSGNTEETLAAFETVAASPATGIAITTGGRLAAEAAAAGYAAGALRVARPPTHGFGYGVFIPLAILPARRPRPSQ